MRSCPVMDGSVPKFSFSVESSSLNVRVLLPTVFLEATGELFTFQNVFPLPKSALGDRQ